MIRQTVNIIDPAFTLNYMEHTGEGDTYRRTIAGDTYNSAACAKRCREDLDAPI